jgi:phosphomannomutase
LTLIKSISGIRGTIGGAPGENLTPLDAVKFASAYGTYLLNSGARAKVVIGRDARLSGEMISNIVSSTLVGLGIDVIDLGLSTTPTVEIAVPDQSAGGGIVITASHNPGQWNALKLLNSDGEFLDSKAGAEIIEIAEADSYIYAEVTKLGSIYKDDSYIQKHIDKILALEFVDVKAIQAAGFRIVTDSVNSTGGISVPPLLKALGVEVVEELYSEPTGHFPHNPEPLPENCTEISSAVKNGGFHLGIVVDPDVDRLCFVCDDGEMFGEEYTLVAVSDYILKNNKGATVSNLSSTRALRDITEKLGESYTGAAVGEVNVVTAMKEVDAVIGGEGNGGIIYPAFHYGRDALVGIALFLSHLAKFGKSISQLKATYPSYHISKNKIELTPDIDVDKVLVLVAEKYKKHPISTLDGVKIEFDNEWVHLRKSNTEPIIRIYSESDSAATADYLANKIISDIKEMITG